MTPAELIEKYPYACVDGQRFAETCVTMEELWDKCPAAPWLLWVQQRTRTLDRHAVETYMSVSGAGSHYTTSKKVGISPALYTALADRAIRAAGSIDNAAQHADRFNAEYKIAMQEQADLVRSLIPNPFKQPIQTNKEA